MSDTSPAPAPRPGRAVLAAPVLLFALYVGAGQLVGDAFPISSFAMYARKARPHTSRVMAALPDGSAVPVQTLDTWRCDRALELGAERCVTPVDFDVTTYLDALDAAWLRDHPDDPDAPRGDLRVDLVRRVFDVPNGGGPVTSTDCLIARCTAARTGE